MSEVEFLLWVRGPGLVIAVAVSVLGWLLRLVEIYGTGRKGDVAPPRDPTPGSGWRTVLSRSVPTRGMRKHSPVSLVGGYIFHLGLFITFFLSIPHIEFIRGIFGFGWPGLPSPLVDFVAVITWITLLVVLVSRLTDRVKRFLSDWADYWAWLVTFLPVLTGWMAYHHVLLSYTTMLAIHILAVEVLLISLPFGKLSHLATLWVSRWYNGDSFARKGVAS